MTDIMTRMRTARERARVANEQDRERAERLPLAICAACGGSVDQGRGTVTSPPVGGSPDGRYQWAQTDAERSKNGLPVFMAWRRRHDECSTTVGILRALLGDEYTPYIAGTALGSLARADVAESSWRPGARPVLAGQLAPDPVSAALAYRDPRPRPWAHLEQADLAALKRAVRAVRNDVEPRRCSEGACAWCGVSTSIGWHQSPEKWADGTRAPLCRTCHVVWDLRGNPTDADRLKACALEALSGASTLGGDGMGIRRYVDVAGDDHAGTAGRWEYAPAPLADLRERARLAWPGSLPPDMRDEYRTRSLRLQREQREQLAAANAQAAREREAAEIEAARQAGWPIS